MQSLGTRSASQEINTWVQIVGIIIAACWEVYTFLYKEIWSPASAPVNINLGMQFRRPSSNASTFISKKPITAIALELTISATNPTPKTTYLLPSAWIAYGIETDLVPEGEPISKWDLLTACI